MSTNIDSNQGTHASMEKTLENPSWWSRRTKLERKLCFVTVVCLLLLAVMVVALAVYGHSYVKYSKNFMSSDSSGENLCLTPGCIKAASKILSNIDENVDPCTDFYQFACGGWLNQHTIPEDKSQSDSFTDLSDDVDEKFKALLETKVDATEPPYIKMIKDLYNSCMDVDTIEEVGTKTLKKVLSIFGGWPVVEGRKWNENNFDWLESLITFRKLGYDHNILLSLSVDVDVTNNSYYTMKLDEPSLGIPPRELWMKLLLNDSSMVAYFKKMVETAKRLGANEVTVEEELREVLLFEVELAHMKKLPSLSDLIDNDVSQWYEKYTVRELQNELPEIPWLKFFNSLVSSEIYENETVVVDSLRLLQIFAYELRTKEKRIIANYMVWRVIDLSLPFLSKEWRDLEFEYRKVLIGASQQKPRWKHCVASVNNNLKIALHSYYIRHHFDEEITDPVSYLIQYIHEEFLRILDETEWMDEVTKAHAKSKAANTKFFLGYPKELLNDTVLIEFYKNLVVTNESYYENLLKISKWRTDKKYSKLRKPNIRGEWNNYANAAMVNAYTSHVDNIIQFPIGILQDPFFIKDRPYYMNFGAIGTVIGHEITHGFDATGRQFDKNGNNVNWWETATSDQFQQKVLCMIEQYSNYVTEIGIKVNGINTQGDNIADNGGLKQAYLAYLTWVEDNGQEQLLPGLNYDQKQLFWISNANMYCAKSRPEALKLDLTLSSHSPKKFRVIGSMSNLEEFSKDFRCPLNSPMNPQHKCRVW